MTGRHRKPTSRSHKPHGGDATSEGADSPADTAPMAPDQPVENTEPVATGGPEFAQPQPSPDPRTFVTPHPSDNAAYKTLDKLAAEHRLSPLPFPTSRGEGPEPTLTLAEVLGPAGDAVTREIAAANQIVFHSVGDTGNIRGPDTQNLVADKMVADFDDPDPADRPQFFFHLGDLIYNFGEAAYYYDQFYAPYREYPAPILALAGNHDGMLAPGATATTLEAFLNNFCADGFQIRPEAGGLQRTAQIQPGVYFTFEAPLVRILCLYSNTLEDPGIISSQGGKYPELSDVQLDYLRAALTRAKDFDGALILAHHHPAYTAGSLHGWSADLTAEVDAICEEVGVWPHAVLSAHAHNYQRFTRVHGDAQIPYLVAGNGGHGVSRLTKRGADGLRAPKVIQSASARHDQVVLENYDDQDFGYLRIVVTQTQLRLEYHPASDGAAAKTPDDFVTVDLKTRRLVHFTG